MNECQVATTECEVEMSLLAQTGLQQGDLISFKVAALNLVGWSSYSDLNAITALYVVTPLKPLTTPSRDDVLTSDLLL